MRYFFTLVLLILSNITYSQDNRSRELLTELNSILSNSDHHHWAYEGLKMKVDSPFAIRDGILSMSLSYRDDSTVYWVRMEAPLEKLTAVTQDVYIILFFKDNDVRISGGESGKPETTDGEYRKLFHIGLPATEGSADSLRRVMGAYLGREDL